MLDGNMTNQINYFNYYMMIIKTMIKMKKKIADFDRSIFVRLVQIGRFVADELTSKYKNNDRSNHTGLYAYDNTL